MKHRVKAPGGIQPPGASEKPFHSGFVASGYEDSANDATILERPSIRLVLRDVRVLARYSISTSRDRIHVFADRYTPNCWVFAVIGDRGEYVESEESYASPLDALRGVSAHLDVDIDVESEGGLIHSLSERPSRLTALSTEMQRGATRVSQGKPYE